MQDLMALKFISVSGQPCLESRSMKYRQVQSRSKRKLEDKLGFP
jgi:hypothetical protein